jgi:DNA-binding PucR family transcriptional regulator
VTTLRYRLERARDLCNLDFEDEETRFALELAFRFRQAELASFKLGRELINP